MSHVRAASLQSPRELQAEIQAEREGTPFLVYRDGAGVQQILRLTDSVQRLIVGREYGVDVRLEWDSDVSRVHAQLERVGESWTLADDGLSRNGTFLNGERVIGRRRLEDRDTIRLGSTIVVYRRPRPPAMKKTSIATDPGRTVTLTDTQRRVLAVLCRPFKDRDAHATPATNQEIAAALFLSISAVKAHLGALFLKFGVDQLPQNQKRRRLVERALQSGAISLREL